MLSEAGRTRGEAVSAYNNGVALAFYAAALAFPRRED